MTRPLILVLMILAALGAAYAMGHRQGAAAVQARLDRAEIAAQAAAAETSKALATAEQTRRAMSQQLEDLANAEPVTSPACVPLSRVRRLNAH